MKLFQRLVPWILLAVALFWGSRLPVLILTLALLSVPAFCRVARAGTLSWARRDFIVAARAIGASDWRIMFGHIAPNILPATAAYGLLTVAVVIIAGRMRRCAPSTVIARIACLLAGFF